MSDTAGSTRDTTGSRDGGTIDQLLLEAGLNDDGGLRPVLLELRALSAGQPMPSDAVAALMVPGAAPAAGASGPAGGAPARTGFLPAQPPADELAARRRAKRRITLTTLSVAVSLAAGGAVAAASDQGIRDTFGQLNHAVSSFAAGSGGGSSDKPATTQVTDSAEPGAAASVPAPAPARSAPAGPASGQAGQATAPDAAAGREGVPAPSTTDAGPSSGITLPQNPVPGLPDAGRGDAGDPGAGLPLTDGPLDGGAPDIPEQQPLPLPATPPAAAAE